MGVQAELTEGELLDLEEVKRCAECHDLRAAVLLNEGQDDEHLWLLAWQAHKDAAHPQLAAYLRGCFPAGAAGQGAER